jgi:predicted Zn finger-like uncharacterized protein
MILTCPSCATRYAVDGAKFPAHGRTVRCSKCGHSWHQPGEAPDPGVTDDALDAEPGDAHREPAEAYPVNPSPTRGFGAGGQVSEPPSRSWAGLAAVVAGWLGLIAVVVLIAVSAVRYRQDIATLWPQSAGVYSSLGLPVHTAGLDFRKVDYKRESEDGQVVLAVSGIILNTAARVMPVPQTVLVTLSDANNNELYHWTFKPSTTSLKPGQSVAFATRLSNPPSAARHLEVRFAKSDS